MATRVNLSEFIFAKDMMEVEFLTPIPHMVDILLGDFPHGRPQAVELACECNTALPLDIHVPIMKALGHLDLRVLANKEAKEKRLGDSLLRCELDWTGAAKYRNLK